MYDGDAKQKAGEQIVGQHYVLQSPWMYAANKDTFKVVSDEEQQHLNELVTKADMQDFTLTFQGKKGPYQVKYMKTSCTNVVVQERKETKTQRTLIKFVPQKFECASGKAASGAQG